MAEAPPNQSRNRTQNTNPAVNELDPNSLQYWCHHCEKRVLIETLADLPDVICKECGNGFVESISAVAQDSPPVPSFRSAASEEIDDLFFGNQFLQEENEVIEERGYGQDVDDTRRRRRDFLRLRLRDFAARAATRRNRVLDWADILMGLQDLELQLQVPGSDTFIGNPGDYVDAAGYEALLQNLVENDNGGRRGAPPASKAAVEGLENMVIGKEEASFACAICKDSLNMGDMAKKLPCGHGYHGDCIVPWLGLRNSCPICRFELPTDDPEYEEERKKRVAAAGLTAGPSSTSSGGGNYDPFFN
ncbi:E3 ubiquitin-protein ligase [Forsythia ovata]|uniref:RING-type E3 ubiquitin transferase n=1 Tax=Forsythia ovata TaxID=205694 RepID=A0ABD1UBG5_9LAMI